MIKKTCCLLLLLTIIGCSTRGATIRNAYVEGFTGKSKTVKQDIPTGSKIYVLTNDSTQDPLFLEETKFKISRALKYNKYNVVTNMNDADYILSFSFKTKAPVTTQSSGLAYEPGNTWSENVQGPSGSNYKVEGSSSGKLVNRQYAETVFPKSLVMALTFRPDKKIIWTGHTISTNEAPIRDVIDFLIVATFKCFGQYCSYNYSGNNNWKEANKMIAYMNTDTDVTQ